MTAPAPTPTIGPMDRTLLTKILDGANGLKKSDTGYLISDEHRASIYLGRSGQTTVLADIVRVALHDGYVEAEAKDRTVHYVLYEPVLGVAIKRPREDVPRTGF